MLSSCQATRPPVMVDCGSKSSSTRLKLARPMPSALAIFAVKAGGKTIKVCRPGSRPAGERLIPLTELLAWSPPAYALPPLRLCARQ